MLQFVLVLKENSGKRPWGFYRMLLFATCSWTFWHSTRFSLLVQRLPGGRSRWRFYPPWTNLGQVPVSRATTPFWTLAVGQGGGIRCSNFFQSSTHGNYNRMPSPLMPSLKGCRLIVAWSVCRYSCNLQKVLPIHLHCVQIGWTWQGDNGWHAELSSALRFRDAFCRDCCIAAATTKVSWTTADTVGFLPCLK